MGTITYNITSGQEPFTAVLTPPLGSPYIETGLSLGVNTFEGIPEGSNYTLTVADSRGCTWVIEDIDFFYMACSDTDVFQYAHSSIVVNNVMFLGERKASPYVVRFPNPDDLSVYTRQAIPGVGSAGQGLESVCYSSSTEKLYFGARDSATGYLAIVEVDPDDVSVYTVHVITSPSPIIADLFVITTDGTYIYGGTDELFFKIRISDWEVIQTNNFVASGFTDSHGAAISIDRGLFYISSQYGVSKLAIVSMTDISSYTIVDLSAHVSHPTDDICIYDDGDVCKVYVAGEWSYVGNGAASVEITNGNLVEGIELLPSYGLWEHCGIVYSAAISNRIQWFDVDNPSVKAEAYIESGYIPNEILIVNNRLFATKLAALGSAKLCELFCVNVVCNTTTTTSTTIDCSIEGYIICDYTTTTTSTSSSSTTTTTTTCYQLYSCGLYDIENPTDDFKQVNWKHCYETSWEGTITLPPHTTYTSPDCREFEASDCYLIFTSTEECTTTTTSTTQDCLMEGYIICDYTTTTTTTATPTTTTTSTTVCSLPSGWTEQGILITNGDFGGNFNVDFTANLDDATEAWINFMCNGGTLYGGIDINGKWWGPHDNFRVYDDVYIRDTCQLVDSGYYILNSTDHYYQIVQIDNGNITTYWSTQCSTTTTTTISPTTTTTTTICGKSNSFPVVTSITNNGVTINITLRTVEEAETVWCNWVNSPLSPPYGYGCMAIYANNLVVGETVYYAGCNSLGDGCYIWCDMNSCSDTIGTVHGKTSATIIEIVSGEIASITNINC